MTREEAAKLARAAKKIPPLSDRFWSKVDIQGQDQCWPWQAAVRRKDEGYGAFWLNGQHHPAHRIAWTLTNGQVPKDLVVCHKCDNPRCCNPGHLFVATPLGNNNDKVNKRRHAYGEQIGTSILTESDVIEIRSARPDGVLQARKGLRGELAKRYGVSKSTISDVWGRSWRHI